MHMLMVEKGTSEMHVGLCLMARYTASKVVTQIKLMVTTLMRDLKQLSFSA